MSTAALTYNLQDASGGLPGDGMIIRPSGTAMGSLPVPPETPAVSLAELRRVLRSDPPVGAEIAQACDYNPKKLAELYGRSVDRLEEIFREFGWTPTRWLQVHKILRELRILEKLKAEGRLRSIKEASRDMGYRHPSDFDRSFKQVIGISPTAFLVQWETALKTLGVDLTECKCGRRSYPLIDIPTPIFANSEGLASHSSGAER